VGYTELNPRPQKDFREKDQDPLISQPLCREQACHSWGRWLRHCLKIGYGKDKAEGEKVELRTRWGGVLGATFDS
jgi:hypothetical protein